ncbi:gamma-glutamylcyclotransferase family protein [Haloparvum sp. AD34]
MDVFVYGTLTDPEQVGQVLDSFVFVGPATLSGLHAVDGAYPTLAPGGRTAGRLLRTDEIEALDAYERVDDGLYTRVTVPLDGGEDHPDEAAVYVGDPDRLDVDGDVDWGEAVADVADGGVEATSADGTDDGFADRVRDFVAREDVSVVVARES